MLFTKSNAVVFNCKNEHIVLLAELNDYMVSPGVLHYIVQQFLHCAIKNKLQMAGDRRYLAERQAFNAQAGFLWKKGECLKN